MNIISCGKCWKYTGVCRINDTVPEIKRMRNTKPVNDRIFNDGQFTLHVRSTENTIGARLRGGDKTFMAGFNSRIVNGLQAFHDLGNGVDIILVAGIIDDDNTIGRDLETLQLRNSHRDIVARVWGWSVDRGHKTGRHSL